MCVSVCGICSIRPLFFVSTFFFYCNSVFGFEKKANMITWVFVYFFENDRALLPPCSVCQSIDAWSIVKNDYGQATDECTLYPSLLVETSHVTRRVFRLHLLDFSFVGVLLSLART